MNKFCRALSLIIFAVFSLNSCTEVDNDFGLGFIPSDQLTDLNSASLTGADGITSYHGRTEAFPATCLGTAFLGQYSDITLGTTTASFYTQFSPAYLFDDDDEADYDGWTGDSLWIYLPFSNKLVETGDETKTQRFYVYLATNVIDSDSTYYSNFDIVNGTDGENGLVESLDTPLAFFDVTSTINWYVPLQAYESEDSLYYDDYKEFMDLLLTLDGGYIDYESDFFDYVNGFYITSEAPANAKNAANDPPSLLISSSYADMSLRLDATDSDGDAQDLYFYLDDSDSYEAFSLTLVSRTYDDSITPSNSDIYTYVFSTSNYDQYGDDFDYDDLLGLERPTTTTVTTGYIHTLPGGVCSILHFSDEFVEKLNELKTQDGIEYGSIVFNDAKIKFPITTDYKTTFNYPVRLGMYYDYQEAVPAPDYLYLSEQSGYTINYDGYLNTSTGKYQMDISNYIQRLVTYDATPRNIFLAPDISLAFTLKQVTIDLTPANIEIEVKYTLVP